MVSLKQQKESYFIKVNKNIKQPINEFQQSKEVTNVLIVLQHISSFEDLSSPTTLLWWRLTMD
jgi:hypothetical protein